jgi:branched-chain amino acid transport system substrate-binding protein
MTYKNNRKIIIIILVLIIMPILLNGCAKEPIKIGFIGSLTSKQSQLSIDGRNAITIGIERINSEGGIDGRPLELIVKDDKGSYETSLEKYEAFKSEGVQFVIGPMTSNLSDAILDFNDSELLFVSPSMSTNLLTGFDDNFIRVCPLVGTQSETFLEYVAPKKYKHLTILYDLSNIEYTEHLSELIRNNGESMIDTIDLIPFDSTEDNIEESFSSINMDKTEGILMISQATDTAFISQKISQLDAEPDLYSVSWSMTQDLMYFGGETIEGMKLIGVYKSPEPTPKQLVFGNSFYERFSYEPSFVSSLAYDAFNVLIEGIKATDDLTAQNVKETIYSIEEFDGLEDPIIIDEYGDSKRKYLIYEVINGRFVPKY